MRLRQPATGWSGVLRRQAGGAGHCRRGVAADRPPRLAQPGSNRRRGRCIRRHLCARRPVPAHRAALLCSGWWLGSPGVSGAGNDTAVADIRRAEDRPGILAPMFAARAARRTSPRARRRWGCSRYGCHSGSGPSRSWLALDSASSVRTEIGGFFGKTMAVVTFGGAYAVLAYVAQRRSRTFGWLAPRRDARRAGARRDDPRSAHHGLAVRGLPRRVPHPGRVPPVACRVLGALLTTWVTFGPCFLWIFLGAPYVERLRGNQALTAALTRRSPRRSSGHPRAA